MRKYVFIVRFFFDVFSSIVNFIDYISAQTRNTKIKSYDKIQELNKNFEQVGRENRLFETLKVNSDEVRLAVVECLNNIDLNQFKASEIGRMVQLLGSYKNPTAGKTEIVLGKLFWLFSKIVMDMTKDVGEEFRKTQARATIKDCIEILVRNQMRIVEKEELDEKEFLSVSSVFFLKCCSQFPELARIISESTKEYCLVLKADEDADKMEPGPSAGSKYESDHISVEVEQTALGSTVHNSLAVFLSANTLDQYSPVCFRVLSSLADVLGCNKVYEIPPVFQETDEEKVGEDKIELMKTYLKDSLVNREHAEEKHWIELTDAWDRAKNFGDKKTEFNKQIKIFLDSGMLEILLNYLIGNCAHRSTQNLVKFLEEFSGDKLKSLKLTGQIIKQVNYLQELYIEKKNEMTKEKGNEEKADSKNGVSSVNLIINELSKETLACDKASGSDEIIDRGISLQIDASKKIKVAPTVGDGKTNTYKSKKMRALTLVAFMRCIFNVYAYADSKGRNEVVKMLRDKRSLIILTKLCFTTDWLDANIGAKYLRLCQFALKLNFETNFTDAYSMELNEICCIAARDIMQFMFNRLKNEDKVPFTNKENVLLVELGRFSTLLFQQITYMPFFSLERILLRGEKPNQVSVEDEAAKLFIVPAKLKKHKIHLPTLQCTCAEYTLQNLLPYKSMYTFSLMLFYYTRKLEELRKATDSKDKLQLLDRIEDARTSTIATLGKYVAMCKTERYLFLEEINKQCIFEKKYIRKSYIQEILTRMLNEFITARLVIMIDKILGSLYLHRHFKRKRRKREALFYVS